MPDIDTPTDTPSNTTPVTEPRNRYFKTVYTVTVLTERTPCACEDLADLGYAITEGDASGDIEQTASYEISARQMAQALQEQGSDPAFLLSEDDLEALGLPDDI